MMTAREVIFSFLFPTICEILNEVLELKGDNRINPKAVRQALHPEKPLVFTPADPKLARACRECWSVIVEPIGDGFERCKMCGHEQFEAPRDGERAVYRAV